MPPFLSIGIPTYNGSRFLKDSIPTVISEITAGGFQDEVEVVFLDNGSTEDIRPLIESQLIGKSIQYQYFKNDLNIGYDRNINKLFQVATGEYVKLLADDDGFLPGGLKEHIDLLKKHNDSLDVLLTNFESYDTELKKPVSNLPMDEALNGKLFNGSQFFANSSGRYGQVSSLTVKRSSWVSQDPEPGFDSQYIHIYMCLKILEKGKALVIPHPTIKVRMGSQNFEKLNADFITVPQGALHLFKMFLNRGIYNENVLEELIDEQHHYILRRLYTAKKNGLGFSFDFLKQLLKSHYDYLPFWFLYLPFYFVPNSLLKGLGHS